MPNTTWLSDIKLQGNHVTLIPLKKEHAKALVQAASDGELWNLWYTSIPNEEKVDAYIATALSEKELGRSLPLSLSIIRLKRLLARPVIATPIALIIELKLVTHGMQSVTNAQP